MTAHRGLTLVEVVVAVVLVASLVALVLTVLTELSRPGFPPATMRNQSNLRGLMQASIIHTSENNGKLPGLDFDGAFLPSDGTAGSGHGWQPAARFWVLLHDDYISADLLINPAEAIERWTTGRLTTSHFSYAASAIRNGPERDDSGRLAEWRQAPIGSNAVALGDRCATMPHPPRQMNTDEVQSVWPNEPGVWNGCVVYGDGHAEYLKQDRPLETAYLTGLTPTAGR